MKELLIVWILTMMNAVAPPHREHHIPEARETHAQADERYRQIAEAIVDASYEEGVKPIFGGERGRATTAMMVATMFYMESGFRRDVDLGTSRVRMRRVGLNDFGRSWCMGQINLGVRKAKNEEKDKFGETSVNTTAEGWTGPELLNDRRKCVKATINLLRASFNSCRHLEMEERLAAYAAGTCDSDVGRAAARVRFNTFRRWSSRDRPKVLDIDVFAELEEESAPIVSFNP